MKKAGFLAASLAAALILGGCSAKGGAEEMTAPSPTAERPTDETELLKRQVAALEDRVQALEDAVAALKKPSESLKTEASEETTAAPSAFLHRIRNGGVEITGYMGEAAVIDVPEKIEGLPVLWIGEGAFRSCKAEAVILPQGVQEIGWFAFSGCYRLAEVTLPASVVAIGYGAFDGCSGTLRLRCPKGSYAADYGRSYGIPVV